MTKTNDNGLEVSARFAVNTTSLVEPAPFFHALVGFHSLTFGGEAQSKVGLGIGMGMRFPVGETRRNLFIIETTYYYLDQLKMLTLRAGFVFGRFARPKLKSGEKW